MSVNAERRILPTSILNAGSRAEALGDRCWGWHWVTRLASWSRPSHRRSPRDYVDGLASRRTRRRAGPSRGFPSVNTATTPSWRASCCSASARPATGTRRASRPGGSLSLRGRRMSARGPVPIARACALAAGRALEAGRDAGAVRRQWHRRCGRARSDCSSAATSSDGAAASGSRAAVTHQDPRCAAGALPSPARWPWRRARSPIDAAGFLEEVANVRRRRRSVGRPTRSGISLGGYTVTLEAARHVHESGLARLGVDRGRASRPSWCPVCCGVSTPFSVTRTTIGRRSAPPSRVGGDTDTMAAMTGAIAGLGSGRPRFPTDFLDATRLTGESGAPEALTRAGP